MYEVRWLMYHYNGHNAEAGHYLECFMVDTIDAQRMRLQPSISRKYNENAMKASTTVNVEMSK
jgi:hypothetical protein